MVRQGAGCPRTAANATKRSLGRGAFRNTAKRGQNYWQSYWKTAAEVTEVSQYMHKRKLPGYSSI
jgi:hypothetical protein